MITEPTVKRAIAFFDGQNLYHSAREAFDRPYPDFDPLKLAKKICEMKGWQLHQVRFYTGIPDKQDNAHWNHFWTAKLGHMGRQRIHTFSRPIRHGKEKGIDIRIALDMVRLARHGNYDVGIVFSQDQDLTEAVQEIKEQAFISDKWIKLASAFPDSPISKNKRGINGTDWIRIDSALYTSCLDPNKYLRPGA
jgi:uncharacterized LabA/DUF88 family protein